MRRVKRIARLPVAIAITPHYRHHQRRQSATEAASRAHQLLSAAAAASAEPLSASVEVLCARPNDVDTSPNGASIRRTDYE